MWKRCLVALLCGVASTAFAQPVVVFDDALQNGFVDYSYGATAPDFASTAQVHSGSKAIAFAGDNFNALSFAHETNDFTTAALPKLRFWAHGGAAGGQQLRIYLQHNGMVVAQAELDSYIAGGAIVAGQWREVVVEFAAAPLSFTGSFDRIDLQSDISGMQSVLYVDDVVLDSPASAGRLLADGFEGDAVAPPPPANGLTVLRDVAIDGLLGDRIGWRDAAGQPREAVLAHNDGGAGAGGSQGGELRELRYQVDGVTRVVSAPATGTGGFGYVVSHPDGGMFCTGGGDSSSLGHFTGGTFSRIFEGRHHAIIRFQQNYPRYCSTTQPAVASPMPVTIDWLFATGRDHPLWAISYDMSAIPVNRLRDDARAPYGELRFDGTLIGSPQTQIAGVGWGDLYKFASTSNPVTYNSGWNWSVANTVPYVKLWTTAVDATMGTVQTQTKVQQDAGGYFGTSRWNTTSAGGDACTVAIGGVDHLMPCDFNWPYQSINYSLNRASPNSPTFNTRLAWGTNFGFLGQQDYPIHGSDYYGGPLVGDPRAPGWPRKSYSMFVVLDRHSVGPVETQVAQIETLQSLTLSAATGSVSTGGPAGVNRPDSLTYSPAGYDPVYSALTFLAVGNALDANVAVGAGTLQRPLLILRGWSGTALPSALRLGGAVLTRDVDWFPSVRSSEQELWITLARDLSGGTNRIEIVP